MKISVCIPTYKGIKLISDAVDSIISQTFQEFEVVICNDSQEDASELKRKLEKYKDKRIKLFQNKKNLGYPLNIKKTTDKAINDVVFLMAQDDIVLDKNLFKKVVAVLKKNPKIGAITRPYYWFNKSIKKPIRYIPKCEKRLIGSQDDKKYLVAVFETLGQFSSLVLKKSLITYDFKNEIFTAHIYPFLSILRTHPCYFWEDFTVAVRTSSSQTRFLSSIYCPSPTKTWVEMFQNVFPEKKFDKIRNVGIDHMTKHYVGLVQIKNYGLYKDLITDIYYLAKHRPLNLISPKFWVFVLGSLLIPRFILRKLVDWYKDNVVKKKLENIL